MRNDRPHAHDILGTALVSVSYHYSTMGSREASGPSTS